MHLLIFLPLKLIVKKGELVNRDLLWGTSEVVISDLCIQKETKTKKHLRHPKPINMFLGEYQHSIDEKGRLAVPVKFRALLATGAVITRGLDGSLFLFPQEEWGKLAAKLSSLPLGRANSRAFARLMLAGAMDVTLDKQGRVVIPEYLRTYGSLDKQVIVAGLYNRLEIWDKAKWEDYKKSTEAEAVNIAEQLSEIGL